MRREAGSAANLAERGGVAMSRAAIRPARLADATALAAVHLKSFRAGNGPHLSAEAVAARTPERNQAEWEGILAHLPGRTAVLVAEIDGRLVGVAGAGPARDRDLDPAATGELYALYVHPEVWGDGHGFALHEAAVRHLAAEGFGSAVLWVLDGNRRARRFYERRGWQTDGSVGDEAGAPKLRYRLEPLHPGSGSAADSREIP
jgi:GNAT superfamily N-acetyltransferase